MREDQVIMRGDGSRKQKERTGRERLTRRCSSACQFRFLPIRAILIKYSYVTLLCAVYTVCFAKTGRKFVRLFGLISRQKF